MALGRCGPLPGRVAGGRALGRRVVVRSQRLELRRASVDGFVGADEALAAVALGGKQLELAEVPEVDLRPRLHLLDAEATAEGLEDEVEAIGRRHLEAVEQLAVALGQIGCGVELARAHRLCERLPEGAADRHRLAHGLHVGRQLAVGAGELLEGEARHLRDDVVDGRLERRGRRPRDVVRDLLERVADGEPRRDLRDREAGRLRGECRGAGDARVHLDDDDLAVGGVDAELHVRAAGLDTDRPDHLQRLVAELLVELVGECLRGRDRDRVAGVDAHRVDVFDRADDDDVVVAVAHQLQFELAPAEYRLLEQHLVDRARGKPLGDDLAQLGLGARGTSPLPAHRECRPDDRRQLHLARGERRLRLADRVDDQRERHAQPRLLHRRPEGLPVLGTMDRLVVGTDQLDPVLVERAVVVQRLGEVERGLSAERRQQRVRLLLRDDLGDDLGPQGLDVGRVGVFGVGHDRRRVRVDEHDLVALLAQHLAGLRPGVVELRRLPDHDRPRADQQDLADVVAPRHQTPTSLPARPAASSLRTAGHSSSVIEK